MEKLSSDILFVTNTTIKEPKVEYTIVLFLDCC